MKLDKLTIQLEKITSLVKSIQKGGGDISAVETDLMRSYIRKLYELTLVEAKKTKSNPGPKKSKKAEKKVQPVAKKQEPVVEEIAPVPDTGKDEIEVQSPAFHVPEEVNELFTHKKAVELSEKLGESHIEDLTKAMGINEKIFTIQELFGGKQQFFNDTIDQLNTFSSFDQAKEHLIKNVAVEYDWGNDAKKKKAGNFIKLVRRRYK